MTLFEEAKTYYSIWNQALVTKDLPFPFLKESSNKNKYYILSQSPKMFSVSNIQGIDDIGLVL